MKSLIKKVVLIAVMVTGLVSLANENDLNVKIKELNSKVVEFTLNNYDGDLQITVKDTHDYVLYKEDFKGTIYSKKYDLSELPSGVYFIEFNGETKVKTVPFTVERHAVEFNYAATRIYFKPIVVVKEKMVNITKLELDSEPLRIEIYDNNLDLIYEENLGGNLYLNRQLNFEELPRGTYDLILRSKDKVITKTIEI